MAETSTAQHMLDQEMIARMGRRDQNAFSALYDRLSGPLYSLAMKMLGDPADAQDALQDVFLQIWSRAGTYDPEQSSVFTWTVLLTRSRVIDRLRALGPVVWSILRRHAMMRFICLWLPIQRVPEK